MLARFNKICQQNMIANYTELTDDRDFESLRLRATVLVTDKSIKCQWHSPRAGPYSCELSHKVYFTLKQCRADYDQGRPGYPASRIPRLGGRRSSQCPAFGTYVYWWNLHIFIITRKAPRLLVSRRDPH